MLRVRRLGRVPYEEAQSLQHALARRADDDYLLVVEHPHVYTLGVRADLGHVLTDPSTVGATLVTTDRGGDVTYHGPGQVVVYPIVTVPDEPGAGPAHVHDVETVVLGALHDLGVTGAGTLDEFPGVWLDADGDTPRKVAAIGVRTIRDHRGRRRTLHGVAVNVDCDLGMFGHIVPCGISDRPVTSLRAEGLQLSVSQVTEALVTRSTAVWGPLGADDAGVVGRSGPPPVSIDGERPPMRRLREAGVDPSEGLPIQARKPDWLRVPVHMGQGYRAMGRTVRELGLVTVCEEAGCPNIYECWADGTATFMVNGDRCTRACAFCQVDTRRPLPLDPTEPRRVAEAVERMHVAHAVITCVARDDLSDGGAGAMAATVHAIRERNPHTKVEVLISDYKGDEAALRSVLEARPDVLNHNIETVVRLQRAVRPSAGYARSLAVLSRAADAGLLVKSGMMVGLGETEEEVVATLADMRAVGVSIATVGQYLRPSKDHLPVARWWTPDELTRIAQAGTGLGLAHVQASPLTRSSYHARRAVEAVG